MPRYYFHLRDHGTLFEDPEGDDFADDAMVREEALMIARETLRVRSLSVRRWLGLSYEITDETGRLAAAVPFSDAIDTEMP